MPDSQADGHDKEGGQGLRPIHDCGVDDAKPLSQVAEELTEKETEDYTEYAGQGQDVSKVLKYLPLPEPPLHVKAKKEDKDAVSDIAHHEPEECGKEEGYKRCGINGTVFGRREDI